MPNSTSVLRLDDFLPYRLSVLTNTISRSIARLYAERFGITVAEWRVMAVLGMSGRLSANEISQQTAMDKVRVSRAVGRMVARDLIERRIDKRDRRRSILCLSDDGRRTYDQIVPLAESVEARLLTVLDSSERKQLDAILNKLQSQAHEIDKGA